MPMHMIVVSQRTPDGKFHHRETHVVDLPRVGTVAAARAWFFAEVWDDFQAEYPTETKETIRVDHVELTRLKVGVNQT